MSFYFDYRGQQVAASLHDLTNFDDLLTSFIDSYHSSTLDTADDVSSATLDSTQFYIITDSDRAPLEEVSQITDGSTVEVIVETGVGVGGGAANNGNGVDSKNNTGSSSGSPLGNSVEDNEKERLRRELEAMKAKLSQLEGRSSGSGSERRDRK
jgi:hypothetical protein